MTIFILFWRSTSRLAATSDLAVSIHCIDLISYALRLKYYFDLKVHDTSYLLPHARNKKNRIEMSGSDLWR